MVSKSGAVKRVFKKKCVRALDKMGREWRKIVAKEIDSQPNLSEGRGIGAVDTGKMQRNMTYRVCRERMVTAVGSPLRYALYVTMGTRNMPKRPFLQNSVRDYADEYRDVLVKTFKESHHKGTQRNAK